VTIVEIRTLLAEHQEDLRRRFGVWVVGIFGSFARGEAGLVSGVNLLIELERPLGWEIVEVKEHLEALLGLRVDIVTRGALRKKPRLRQSIEEDFIRV